MGYLDNDTIVVDAILTKHGRELLSEGQAINPSHFALSDDGVDYTLWNTSSPSGSSGYDDYISKLPMIEAVPSDEVMMRYTLVSLPQNTRYLPSLAVLNTTDPGTNAFTLDNKSVAGDTVMLEAKVSNYASTGAEIYTFTFFNWIGLQVLETDGSQPTKITGHAAKPYEQNAPITVKITGATYVKLGDTTVTKDTKMHYTIQHEKTGVRVDGSVTVKAA